MCVGIAKAHQQHLQLQYFIEYFMCLDIVKAHQQHHEKYENKMSSTPSHAMKKDGRHFILLQTLLIPFVKFLHTIGYFNLMCPP